MSGDLQATWTWSREEVQRITSLMIIIWTQNVAECPVHWEVFWSVPGWSRVFVSCGGTLSLGGNSLVFPLCLSLPPSSQITVDIRANILSAVRSHVPHIKLLMKYLLGLQLRCRLLRILHLAPERVTSPRKVNLSNLETGHYKLLRFASASEFCSCHLLSSCAFRLDDCFSQTRRWMIQKRDRTRTIHRAQWTLRNCPDWWALTEPDGPEPQTFTSK